jgi:predicted short-subunit dehydrogenase-like oxidoreductase (DUF2520 family)
MIQKNISFAGAGRVATAICRAIFEAGFNVELIVSLSEQNGRSLAESCEASWSPELLFPNSTDIIIVAVPDHCLKNVLERIKCRPETLVAHTAGSVGLDHFPEHIKRRGVFYPLQTFSKGRKVDFNKLPILLESSDIHSSEMLQNLAISLGGETHFVSAEQRMMIHLSAVFICNFTNHMLTQGKQVALKAGVPFKILYPLLKETVSKAIDIGPERSQTGPAIRDDQNTIEKHLELLSFSPELQRIYSEITTSIIMYYKTND